MKDNLFEDLRNEKLNLQPSEYFIFFSEFFIELKLAKIKFYKYSIFLRMRQPDRHLFHPDFNTFLLTETYSDCNIVCSVVYCLNYSNDVSDYSHCFVVYSNFVAGNCSLGVELVLDTFAPINLRTK